MKFNESFWDNRYKTKDIGWDLGEISPPIKAYIDQLSNTSQKILIPGGGNAYEAEYLFKKGFQNVYVVDISDTALGNLKRRVPDFPEDQLLHLNFFNLKKSFDLIIEQTFFCALHPILRGDYVNQTYDLLSKEGKLIGLLFDVPLNAHQPPFGGSKKEYKTLFDPKFDILKMEKAYNSIEPRQGKELFIMFKKK